MRRLFKITITVPDYSDGQSDKVRRNEKAHGLVDRLVERLADSQVAIFKMVAGNPQVTKISMAKSIGISTTAMDKNLRVLKARKLLRRVGSARSGHWEVVQD